MQPVELRPKRSTSKEEDKAVLSKEHLKPQQLALTLSRRVYAALARGDVFEEGVGGHYYTQNEIQPITTDIRQHIPIKIS